jgi:hypothetical protein
MNGPIRINSLRYKHDIVEIKKYLLKMGQGYQYMVSSLRNCVRLLETIKLEIEFMID